MFTYFSRDREADREREREGERERNREWEWERENKQTRMTCDREKEWKTQPLIVSLIAFIWVPTRTYVHTAPVCPSVVNMSDTQNLAACCSHLCLPSWWARIHAWEKAALCWSWMTPLQRPLCRASSLTVGEFHTHTHTHLHILHKGMCASLCWYITALQVCLLIMMLRHVQGTTQGCMHADKHTHVHI
jgi:hypothetical protein